MINEFDSIFNVQLGNYIEKEKIEHLYRKTVDKIEKQMVETRELGKDGSLVSEGKLGKLLDFIGIDFSIKGDLKLKSSKSEQVISELAPEHKLKIVLHSLIRENSLINLNKFLAETINIVPECIVNFKCSVKFLKNNPSDSLSDPDTKILVIGKIENFKLKFICSRKYFIADSSLEFDIYEKIVRDINGIASLKNIDLIKKQIYLNPIYF